MTGFPVNGFVSCIVGWAANCLNGRVTLFPAGWWTAAVTGVVCVGLAAGRLIVWLDFGFKFQCFLLVLFY